MRLDNNNFFANRPASQIKEARRAIRKQVIAEYQTELYRSIGWRKYLVRFRVNIITEIRYRGILFMGAAGFAEGNSTTTTAGEL